MALLVLLRAALVAAIFIVRMSNGLNYAPVDTDQTKCFDDQDEIDCPDAGDDFYGQDGSWEGNVPSYTDNGDDTVYDEVTGLTWTTVTDFDTRYTYDDGIALVDDYNSDQYAGYSDWRVPTTKELYSLIRFSGLDPKSDDTSTLTPFIDEDYFPFEYGSGDYRTVDVQFITQTVYTSSLLGTNDKEFFFGVNFADGRIKGYETYLTREQFYVMLVRGNEQYGTNNFQEDGNGVTITDSNTGLTWVKSDSGEGLVWEDALLYCEELEVADYSDWRLPNAKELHTLVNYSRSPDYTGSAAIDGRFEVTEITNEGGESDFPWYWSSTTHEWSAGDDVGGYAVYIPFGRAMGYYNDEWVDVHGAGCQRSDPKTGDPDDYPYGDPDAPQGDAVRIYNYARCVRGQATESTGDTSTSTTEDTDTNIEDTDTNIDSGTSSANRVWVVERRFVSAAIAAMTMATLLIWL